MRKTTKIIRQTGDFGGLSFLACILGFKSTRHATQRDGMQMVFSDPNMHGEWIRQTINPVQHQKV